ncbi:Ig-like domain-containing protein [Seonamhaeicola sp.]|uniref:Ig-like domain-containing protein n=1 Tax=Seonamhaeicola sp. TaxID=1912245 RepID=UPI002630167C|nr:Ig-like domain-containing protein [Seonamhaeicola sp.]
MLLCFVVLTTSAQNAVQVAGTATAQSAQTGDWTNPATWVGNQVPGANARVLINANHTVTVNGLINTDYKSVRVAANGTLNYADGIDTELRTEYLVTEAGSNFIIGTSTNSIDANRTARLTFAWLGGTTQSQDPSRFAPGAVLMGTVRMYGAPKTSWTSLAVNPSAGATQLSLGAVPSGWRSGDQLVVAGTNPNDYTSDEVVQISSISGSTVTLNSALTKSHQPPSQIASLVQVHVSNNTRNIIVSSSNPSTTALSGTSGFGKPRGHMMFMHNSDVILNYVETENTGRTDKSIQLDDWEVPDDENARSGPYPPVAGGGKNPRGRYSIHFHRSLDFNTNKATVEGCVVNNDPGWGYVNHTSNVDFINNVSYDVLGSGFCTEAGDELGSFNGNIAIRSFNPSLPMDVGRPAGHPFNATRNGAVADQREGRSDFAWQGDGFWFHSAGVSVENNVVSGSSGHAFVYWSDGLFEPNRGRPTMQTKIDLYVPPAEFPALNADLKNHQAQYPAWIYDVWYILPRPFKNNQAYSMARGVHGYYLMTEFHEAIDPTESEFNVTPTLYRNTMKLVIENSTLWSMKRIGVGFNHSAQVTLKNNKVYGYGTSTALAPWNQSASTYPYVEQEPAVIGMDLDHYHNTRNWVLENNTVVGFNGEAIAVTLPANADVVVNGGTFDNSGTDIKIREVNWRKNWNTSTYIVNASDTNFDPLPKAPWDTTPWRNITIQGNIQFNNPNKNIVLDPQFHLTNPAQDGFAILDGDFKQTGYFMLPDNIILNFGPFNNSKVYFEQQRGDFTPVTSSAFLVPREVPSGELFPENTTPNKYLNKDNQTLRTQYGVSFGGEITPSGTQTHPILIGGTVTNLSTGNQSPTVSITSPNDNDTFTAGSNITITANAADADGTITKVEFFQGSTKLGEATSSPYSYTWANVTQGAYALTAVATDNNSATTTSATVNITVNAANQAPTVSITNPSDGATFTAGGNIAITADAVDADGTITRVEFFQGSTKLGEATSSPYSYSWTNVTQGSYALTAVATDNNSVTTTSAIVNITVNAANQTPTVSITSPSDGATFTAGDNVAIAATASDADGTITKVEFFQGSTKLGEATSSPYSYTWANVTQGNYALTAVATDNNSAATTSAIVNITVNASGGNSCSGLTYNDYLGAGHATGVSVTASTTDDSATAIKTVNGNGLSGGSNGTHNNIWNTGWGSTSPNNQWIQYDFGASYPLGQMHVWNANETPSRGLNNVTIKYSDTSSNPSNMTTLGTFSWPQASGANSYAGFAGPNFAGVSARYVRIEVNSNFGDEFGVALAEVRFDLNCSSSPTTYSLTTNATSGGSVSAGGTYNAGQVANVTATPDNNFQFTGWSGDASGTINPLPLTIDANKTVTANFAPITYTLTVNASPTAGGSVSGGGTYNAGTVVNITATPAAGYQFDNWSGAASGTNPSTSITLNGNQTVTANFSQTSGNSCSGLTYNDYLGAGHATGVSVTASTTDDSATAIKTVNGNGLSGGSNGTHNNVWNTGWGSTSPNNQWIQYDFGAAYPLGQMYVWNGNETPSRGLNNVTIKYSDTSSNPSSMTTLGTYSWPQASGANSYAGFTGPDFAGVNARYVRIEVNSNHGDEFGVALAEVRFDLNCSSSAKNVKSPTIADSNSQSIQITLFPNPVKFDEVNVRFSGIKDQVWLNIFDTAGRQLISEQVKVDGNMTHKVDLSNFQSGNYFMILEHSKGTRSFQLIKE